MKTAGPASTLSRLAMSSCGEGSHSRHIGVRRWTLHSVPLKQLKSTVSMLHVDVMDVMNVIRLIN